MSSYSKTMNYTQSIFQKITAISSKTYLSYKSQRYKNHEIKLKFRLTLETIIAELRIEIKVNDRVKK